MTLSDLFIPVKNFTEIKGDIQDSFMYKEKSDLSNSTIHKSEHYKITNDFIINTDWLCRRKSLLFTNTRWNEKIDIGNLQNCDILDVSDESKNCQDKHIHNSLINNEIKSYFINMEVKKEKNHCNNNSNEYDANESKFLNYLFNNDKFSVIKSNKNSIITKVQTERCFRL